MNKIVITVLIVLSFEIAGCSATGPVFKKESFNDESKSLLYIYRPSTFFMGARTVKFEIDGEVIAELNNNGYAKVYVSSGKSRLKQSWNYWLLDEKHLKKALEIDVDFQKGKTHYVRFEVNHGYSWELAEVEEELAMSQIRKTVLQEQTFKIKE